MVSLIKVVSPNLWNEPLESKDAVLFVFVFLVLCSYKPAYIWPVLISVINFPAYLASEIYALSSLQVPYSTKFSLSFSHSTPAPLSLSLIISSGSALKLKTYCALFILKSSKSRATDLPQH